MKELEVHCNRGWRQAINGAPPFVRGRRQSAGVARPRPLEVVSGWSGLLAAAHQPSRSEDQAPLAPGNIADRYDRLIVPATTAAFCSVRKRRLRAKPVITSAKTCRTQAYARSSGYQPVSGPNRAQFELIDAASKTQEVQTHGEPP